MGDAAPEVVELGLGNADLEDEQRDRDREYAVTERLHPAGAPVVTHRDSPQLSDATLLRRSRATSTCGASGLGGRARALFDL